MPMTDSPRSSSSRATWKPMKPAAPVTPLVIAAPGRCAQRPWRSQAPISDAAGHRAAVDRRLHVDEDAARAQHREKPLPAALAEGAVRHGEHEPVEVAQIGDRAKLET